MSFPTAKCRIACSLATFSWLLAITASLAIANDSKVTWAIALHGGAGSMKLPIEADVQEKYKAALTAALKAGKQVLQNEGSALDAVQAAVIVLEDQPLFNAGKGAVFTRAGTHELDASIMDGATLRCGGVAGVTNVKNPVAAARVVMQQTPHLLMRGRPAEQLAEAHGCEVVGQSYFYTERRFETLQNKLRKLGLPELEAPAYGLPRRDDSQVDNPAVPEVGGTVGCVALDAEGNLAAATSTGGLTGKMVGRIGDSPICGAGNFANQHVAVSGTGKGEEYIRHSVAAKVAWLVESGDYTLEEAVRHCLEVVLKPGDGGLIVIDRRGNVCLHNTTGTMPCGSADSTGKFSAGILINQE